MPTFVVDGYERSGKPATHTCSAVNAGEAFALAKQAGIAPERIRRKRSYRVLVYGLRIGGVLVVLSVAAVAGMRLWTLHGMEAAAAPRAGIAIPAVIDAGPMAMDVDQLNHTWDGRAENGLELELQNTGQLSAFAAWLKGGAGDPPPAVRVYLVDMQQPFADLHQRLAGLHLGLPRQDDVPDTACALVPREEGLALMVAARAAADPGPVLDDFDSLERALFPTTTCRFFNHAQGFAFRRDEAYLQAIVTGRCPPERAAAWIREPADQFAQAMSAWEVDRTFWLPRVCRGANAWWPWAGHSRTWSLADWWHVPRDLGEMQHLISTVQDRFKDGPPLSPADAFYIDTRSCSPARTLYYATCHRMHRLAAQVAIAARTAPLPGDADGIPAPADLAGGRDRLALLYLRINDRQFGLCIDLISKLPEYLGQDTWWATQYGTAEPSALAKHDADMLASTLGDDMGTLSVAIPATAGAVVR